MEKTLIEKVADQNVIENSGKFDAGDRNSKVVQQVNARRTATELRQKLAESRLQHEASALPKKIKERLDKLSWNYLEGKNFSELNEIREALLTLQQNLDPQAKAENSAIISFEMETVADDLKSELITLVFDALKLKPEAVDSEIKLKINGKIKTVDSVYQKKLDAIKTSLTTKFDEVIRSVAANERPKALGYIADLVEDPQSAQFGRLASEHLKKALRPMRNVVSSIPLALTREVLKGPLEKAMQPIGSTNWQRS